MKEFELLCTGFKVNDLLNKHSKIVFVLESPHKDELKYGVPVAGRSGSTMTKTLFGGNIPLGRFLNEQWKNNNLLEFGIMNICNIPMQRSAYEQLGQKKDLETFFDALEKLRTTNAKKIKDPYLLSLEKCILNNLQGRMNQFRDKALIIIPCGRFANKFIKKINLPDNFTIIEDIPHPSYNSWGREKYKKDIQEMLKTIEKNRNV